MAEVERVTNQAAESKSASEPATNDRSTTTKQSRPVSARASERLTEQTKEELARQEAERRRMREQQRQELEAAARQRQAKLDNYRSTGKRQSGAVLITFFAVGILVSAVDVTFLSDVFGRILNMSATMATGLSMVVGLAAMVLLMGFYGYKQYYGEEKTSSNWLIRNLDVVLWFALGIFLMVLRILSANFINLSDNDTVLHFGGMAVRGVDLIMGTVMFVFYLGAGTLAMYCIRNFFNTDMYLEMRMRSDEKKARRATAMARQSALMDEKRAMKEMRRDEMVNSNRAKQKAKLEAKAEAEARRPYDQARQEYEAMVERVHREHDQITTSLGRLEAGYREIETTQNLCDHLVNNVVQARRQVQGQVAMLVNAQSKVSVETLNGIIDDYNAKHPFALQSDRKQD